MSAQLKIVKDFPASSEMFTENIQPANDHPKDYFIVEDGLKFAGRHLIVDLWGATRLDDPEHIDRALCEAAITAGATILHHHFHHFTPNGGVSGVVVLWRKATSPSTHGQSVTTPPSTSSCAARAIPALPYRSCRPHFRPRAPMWTCSAAAAQP